MLVFASASLSALLVIACATGTEGAVILDGDATPETDSSTRDVNVVPSRDSGGAVDDGSTRETDSGGGGTCTKKVVINELMVDGKGEFVELYNPNTCAVPLGGWRIAYRSAGNMVGSASHTFATGASIASKAFLVVGTADFAGKKDATFSGGFGNSGGQIGLLDDAMAIVDAVGYDTGTSGLYTEGSPATNPAAGSSIARKSDGVDTGDNKSDFKTSTPHTAGAAN
jgi:hypothetical protein